MPYIVCVNRPGCLPEQDPVAVATIDEAREAAFTKVSRIPGSALVVNPLHDSIHALPEAGGVIGPLADGYVIDVQRKSWEDLFAIVGTFAESFEDFDGDVSLILDAYNQH